MKKTFLFIFTFLSMSLSVASAQEYYQKVLVDSSTGSSTMYLKGTATVVTQTFNIYDVFTLHHFVQDTSAGTDSVAIRAELWQTDNISSAASWVKTATLDDSLKSGSTDFNSNFYGQITKVMGTNYAAMPYAKVKYVGITMNSRLTPVTITSSVSVARGR